MSDSFSTGLDRLLIDGELRPAASGAIYQNLNPATEEVLGKAADADAGDMDAAIAAARRAFDTGPWRSDRPLRQRAINQLRDALIAHGAEMRALTTAEVGAPKFLTEGPQYDAPVDDLSIPAALTTAYEGWTVDLGEAAPMGVPTRRRLVREPAGVVGAITPWNFPHQINLAKLGPALAAGCTIVLKAAPDTPWCATALGRIIAEETEIPPGVVNIVTSTDHSVGAQLSADPRVDIVSFTGSTATGRKVMATAAANLTKVFLELGGKSAFIVLDDADAAGAGALAGFTASTHAGQGCAITTRLLVPKSRSEEVIESAAATMAALAAGDPTQDGVVCGPLISALQRDRVEGYLQLAREEGGTFVVGGGRSPNFDKGYFIDPTLVVGLDNSARVAREEIFGPVLTVIEYEGGDEEAIRIANDSPYGLSGSVMSADRDRAWKVAEAVRTGTMSVNGGVWYGGDVPFGGYKHSGIGREMGVMGFEEYLETKAIAEGV
jgi:aldehyde dehydrogenase (NAD+)